MSYAPVRERERVTAEEGGVVVVTAANRTKGLNPTGVRRSRETFPPFEFEPFLIFLLLLWYP